MLNSWKENNKISDETLSIPEFDDDEKYRKTIAGLMRQAIQYDISQRRRIRYPRRRRHTSAPAVKSTIIYSTSGPWIVEEVKKVMENASGKWVVEKN